MERRLLCVAVTTIVSQQYTESGISGICILNPDKQMAEATSVQMEPKKTLYTHKGRRKQM